MTTRRTRKRNQVNGWDERDYKLWGQLMSLPNYGLVAGRRDNPLLALKDVIKLLEKAAEKRFDDGIADAMASGRKRA
jgi:hypothetical protein